MTDEGESAMMSTNAETAVESSSLAREGPPRRVVSVEIANSDRSKCKDCSCLGLIRKGEKRIGVPMFQGGRTTTGWFHPKCFVSNGLVAEIVDRNAGLCKQSRAKFQKGDFRLRVSCGNAKFGLSLAGAKKLLPEILEAAEMSVRDIHGVDNLPASERAAFLGLSSSIKSASKPTVAKQKSPKKTAATPSTTHSKRSSTSDTKVSVSTATKVKKSPMKAATSMKTMPMKTARMVIKK